MTHWKSYHLLGESFADTDDAPALLFRWSVERVVDGLTDHDVYSQAVARAATRQGAMQRAERRMLQLMALDANPVAELMRTARDASAFQMRWNGFNRMAPLGVETLVSCDAGLRLQRETRAAGLHDEMREQAGAICVSHLMADNSPLRQRHDEIRPLARHFGELGYANAALRDSVDSLYADPFAELDQCAGAVGASRRTLQRAFTQAGLSFRLLRQAVRLTLASHAMCSSKGGESLTAIAHASGFFDSAHLVHAWKQSCGLTPSQYRSLC
ncbi:helix-turn-helix domain-containing protein [Variovorax sp. PAMC26660]|uniref:helix-turn-helix domain-containing protein n=1 Tax=Variovorax sp. PAMC26660 TaxID=2762322 RepID=UPI00164DCD04|nr:helix-turn-helix domain-containing protein [Variovorax sp. PAMC26660]QNK67518.1 AraC family transcriptional regulator [Variovorax sp. PAMC26660]